MNRRMENIKDLLDHLLDFEPAPACGVGVGGDEPPRMPAIYWEPEVQALYDALERLRLEPELDTFTGRFANGRTVHAHVLAYYRSEVRIVRPKVKRIHGRVWRRVEAEPGQWKRERIVSGWVVPHLVTAGEGFLELVYGGGVNGRIQPVPVSALLDRIERRGRQRAVA